MILILVSRLAPGQEQIRIDSLKNMLNYPLPDTNRVQLLNEIAEEHLYIEHKKIFDYAQQALEISQSIGYPKGIAESYNNLGTYYRAKGIYDESIDYYFNSLEIMEQLNDLNGIGRCYNLIGILYFNLENFDLSLEYYNMALEINYQQNDRKWIAGNSNNVGMIYARKKEYEKAMEFYLKSLEMNIELGHKNWIANNYGNIGELYQLMDNPLSLEYFKRRLKIKEEQNDTDGIAASNLLIGNYFVEEALLQDAILYLRKAYDLSLISRSLSILNRASGKLSEAYVGLNNFEVALEFEKLNKIYSDSLKLSANTEKITRLQMNYKHNKDQQIDRLKYENSRLVQTLVAVALFFILIFILLIYNQQRIRARQHKLEQTKLLMANKLLQEELEFKEKMLQDNINYLLNINELLTNIVDRFNEIKSISKPENQKFIKDIIENIQTGINDDFWEEFELRFNQIHKDFYQKLNEHFPDLSSNEKKLCAFLKLKMTSKDISSITSMSIKSIDTARSRLRKKLNIIDKSLGLPEFFNKL